MQAIGAFTAYISAGSGTAPVTSDAQLLRLQKELSDCVNCASAKTALGKAKILAVEARINAVKARMELAATRSQRDVETSPVQQLNRVQSNLDMPLVSEGVGSIINTNA